MLQWENDYLPMQPKGEGTYWVQQNGAPQPVGSIHYDAQSGTTEMIIGTATRTLHRAGPEDPGSDLALLTGLFVSEETGDLYEVDLMKGDLVLRDYEGKLLADLVDQPEGLVLMYNGKDLGSIRYETLDLVYITIDGKGGYYSRFAPESDGK